MPRVAVADGVEHAHAAVREAGDGVSVRATLPALLVDDVVATVRELLGTGLIGLVVPDGMRAPITRAVSTSNETVMSSRRNSGAASFKVSLTSTEPRCASTDGAIDTTCALKRW